MLGSIRLTNCHIYCIIARSVCIRRTVLNYHPFQEELLVKNNMKYVWFWLFAAALLLNLFQARWTIIRNLAHVPVPDNGTWGMITTDPDFFTATIQAHAEVGDPPLCTANSQSDPDLRRFIFADGRLVNNDTNLDFIAQLGDAKAFFAKPSSDPRGDAEKLSAAYNKRGIKTFVVEHYADDMKGKMFFVSFRDCKYNPGWVFAYRLDGRKLGPTEPWQP